MTKIYYIDASVNYNFSDHRNDIIIIDKNVLDYPKAHDYVIEHELEHSRIGDDLIGQILHEIKNDYTIHVSNSEVSKSLNKYFEENKVARPRGETLEVLRHLWLLFLILPIATIDTYLRFTQKQIFERP